VSPEHLFVSSGMLGVHENECPRAAETAGGMTDPDETGADMNDPTSPALLASEARVFGLAALRMLDLGETQQAALLFARAVEFARTAA
jgi:hypothetical protein